MTEVVVIADNVEHAERRVIAAATPGGHRCVVDIYGAHGHILKEICDREAHRCEKLSSFTEAARHSIS